MKYTTKPHYTTIFREDFPSFLVGKKKSSKSSRTLVQSSVKLSAAARPGKQWGWKGAFALGSKGRNCGWTVVKCLG